MSWRPARSLIVLRDQVNEAWPSRNKASDGIIGDVYHQGTVSEHNPSDDVDGDGWGEGPNVDDIVLAIDITHDPEHGCDIDKLSDALVASRDARISYVIANRLITGPNYNWVWTSYDGDDPHTNHLHLSLLHNPSADDTRPWSIGEPDVLTEQQNAWLAEIIEILRALAEGKDHTYSQPVRAQAQLNTLEKQVATLVNRPATPLTSDQLNAIGTAAGKSASAGASATINERLTALERRVDAIARARVAAADAEKTTITS